MIICLCIFTTHNIDQVGGPETFLTLFSFPFSFPFLTLFSFPFSATTTAKLLAFLIDPLIKKT